MELQTLGAVNTLLQADTELTTQGGINPATGAPRAVKIYNQPVPNAKVPYVRLSLTDLLPLTPETHNVGTLDSYSIFILVDVFSEYEPEVWKIVGLIKGLIGDAELTTADYHGFIRFENGQFFVDNITVPDFVFRRASLRFRCNMAPA